MERGMRIMSWVQVFFVYKSIISAVKRVEFVSDRMSYIILRGHWCHIMVLNVHAPTEDRIDDVKDKGIYIYIYIFKIKLHGFSP
jgi:hypothetical protein